MRKESGFTLTELMIVIAIIALLGAMATPVMLNWLPKYRLGSAARSVLSAIEQTRLRAVRQDRDATLKFNLADAGYTASVNGVPAGSGTLPAGISIDTVTFAGDTLGFNRQGMPSEGGTVTLKNSRGALRNITVSFGGNARIQ